MKTHYFTHPQAPALAKLDSMMANDLMNGKSVAIRHNGERIKIKEFKSYTMHSQEASRFFITDNEGYMIAFFANGQFWDSLTKTLIELE